MASVFGRNPLPEGTLSPNRISFREEMPHGRPRRYFCPRMRYLSGRNPPPGGTLSPNGISFREKPTTRGHIVPKSHQFPGRNAMRAPKEILLSPNEVSFREKPTPRGHFVPKWHQFPGEIHPRGHFVPKWHQFPGGTFSSFIAIIRSITCK